MHMFEDCPSDAGEKLTCPVLAGRCPCV